MKMSSNPLLCYFQDSYRFATRGLSHGDFRAGKLEDGVTELKTAPLLNPESHVPGSPYQVESVQPLSR